MKNQAYRALSLFAAFATSGVQSLASGSSSGAANTSSSIAVNGGSKVINPVASVSASEEGEDSLQLAKNRKYCGTLLENLQTAVDKWFTTGSPYEKDRIIQIMENINRNAMHNDDMNKALRMVNRATFPLPQHLSSPQKSAQQSISYSTSANNIDDRAKDAQTRKEWESNFSSESKSSSSDAKPRSALSARAQMFRNKHSSKVADFREKQEMDTLLGRADNVDDLFLKSSSKSGISPAKVAKDKKELEEALSTSEKGEENQMIDQKSSEDEEKESWASSLTSSMVTKAGSGQAFTGMTL